MSPTSGSSCLRLPNSAQQLCNAMSPMHAHFRCSLIRTQHIMTRVCLDSRAHNFRLRIIASGAWQQQVNNEQILLELNLKTSAPPPISPPTTRTEGRRGTSSPLWGTSRPGSSRQSCSPPSRCFTGPWPPTAAWDSTTGCSSSSCPASITSSSLQG